MMSKILAALCLLLFISPDDSDIIYWRKGLKLTYEDFQGDTLIISSEYLAATSAQTKYDMHILNNVLYFNVYTYFEKKNSPMKINNPNLLQHEQNHFNIREVQSRKIRRYLFSLTGKEIYKNTIQENIKLLNKENIFLDSLYDAETYHGALSIPQQEWDIKTQKMLDSLRDFEHTEGNVPIK